MSEAQLPSKFGSSNLTHTFDADGNVTFCSEAVDMLHWDAETDVKYYTGFGFCEHYTDIQGLDSIVHVGPDDLIGTVFPSTSTPEAT